MKEEDSFATESVSRRRKRKRFFVEPEQNLEKQLCTNGKYKQEVFNKIFECPTIAIKDRFNAINNGITPFSFLFDIKKLLTVTTDVLKSHCIALETKLTENGKKDIFGKELSFELMSLSSRFTENLDPGNALKYLYANDLDEIYANVSITLRILLTLPITVASAKRSFSKLKIIKNYLRLTMGEERLNNLAMISIENKIAADLNIEDKRFKFFRMKARKVLFSR